MMLPQFIRIEKSIGAAMRYRSGADMQFFSFAGIHVVPNRRIRQYTSISTGITLPAIFSVELLDMCGDVITVLPQSMFVVESTFTDKNGFNQIEWSFTSSYDAGNRPVYLRIAFRPQGALFNIEFYTSPFYLTNYNLKYVTRWYYRNNDQQAYLSIGLLLYYRQDASSEDITTYDRRSSGKTTTLTTDITDYEIWRTKPIDYKVIGLIKRMIACRFVYSSNESSEIVAYRTQKHETFDIPVLEGNENHAQTDINLIRDFDDVFTTQLGAFALWSSTEVLMSSTGYLYSRNNP